MPLSRRPRSEDVDEAEARAGRTTVDHSTAQDVEEEGASIKLVSAVNFVYLPGVP